MYLKEIIIKNFGPIRAVDLKLDRKKLNLILGNNESGKTNILGSLAYLFYGNKFVSFQKDVHTKSSVRVIFNNAGIDFDIKKECLEHISHITFDNEDDISNIIKNFNCKNLIIIREDELFSNKKFSKKDLEEIKIMIDNTSKLDINEKNELKDKFKMDKFGNEKNLVLMSTGVQILYNLFLELKNIKKSSTIIMDSVLGYWDSQTIKLILNFLIKTNKSQFILMENKYILKLIDDKLIQSLNIIELTERNNQLSHIGYKYSNSFKEYFLPDTKSVIENKKEIVNYIFGGKIPKEENKYCEFKEIKGKNFCNSILKNGPNYIVAYLNSDIEQNGIIFWGISDNREIKGVKLNYSERDEIRRKLSESLNKIKPFLNPDNYKIEFKKIYDKNGKLIKDLFIIEVIIKPVNNTILYSNARDEIYMKTEGGKRKLDTHEIQIELKRRMNRNTKSHCI